jgi:DNA-binding PadR family transcriptional regulator
MATHNLASHIVVLTPTGSRVYGMTRRLPPRSPLAVVVLTLLAEAPMHAYRMRQLIKERAKDTVVNVERSNSVYQTIARLQRDELIRVREQLRDERRPERTVYEITEAGLSTLRSWLDTMLSTPAREFPEFPAALACLPITTPDHLLRQLEARASRLAALTEAAPELPLPRVLIIEEEYKQAMAEAELAWVRTVIDDLRAGRLDWSEEQLRPLAESTGTSPGDVG